jgi:HD-GYP domain-containing protein (c-di-GMP phosphodiesterase class II)
MSLQPNLEEQELLADTLRQADDGLTPREIVIELLFSLAFLCTVAALWRADPPHAVALLPSALCFLVMVVATRVRFDTPFGYTVATQLAFVPLLFALPVAIVPLAVVAAMMLARLPELISGEHPPIRLIKEVGNSWFAIGPVAVFALAGISPADAGPALLVAALAAQFAVDFAASTLRLALERAATLAAQLRESWVYVIDAALSVMGLVVAEELETVPLVALAPLPMLGLLALFARERHERMKGLIELNNAYRGTALVLGDVVEADDGYTGAHSKSVVALALALGDRLALDPAQRRNLEFGALLHDVGKIGIADNVLQKPGRLTDEEFAIVKLHPVIGRRILEGVQGFAPYLAAVELHHENWNGTGYPKGQCGEETPIEARIIHVSDAYDAMTTDRSYRRGMTHERAITILIENAGTQFDPRIVDVFINLPRGILTRHTAAPAVANQTENLAEAVAR